MPNLLLIDTSGPCCQVGLRGVKFSMRHGIEERQSAQSLLPLIADLCSDSEVPLSGLDAVAVMAGPGSFTGLRIGVGVAQALTMANNIPGIALSNLAVFALHAGTQVQAQKFLVALSARDGEIYFGAYQRDDKLGVSLLLSEQVAAVKNLDLPKNCDSVAFVGAAWQEDSELDTIRKQVNPGASVLDAELNLESMGRLAAAYYEQGLLCEPSAIRPNYIKEQLDY